MQKYVPIVSPCVFAISLCVIFADGCRKVCLSYLLVFSRTGSVWPPRIHAESSDHSVSLFFYPQTVRHLVGNMEKGQLMCADVSSCDFSRRLWVILPDTSAMVCSWCRLVFLPTASTWSRQVDRARCAHDVFFFTLRLCVISSDKFGVASPYVFAQRMYIISLLGIRLERIADNVCSWCHSQLVRNSVE